jgi:PAS domain-containing protein
VAHVAPDGRWLRVNGALCRTLGYLADDLLSKSFQDVIYPDDLAADLVQVAFHLLAISAVSVETALQFAGVPASYVLAGCAHPIAELRRAKRGRSHIKLFLH